METKKEKSLSIASKRSDTEIKFFLYKGKPLVTNKGLDEIAAYIVREYPDIAEKVAEADKIASGAKTDVLDLSALQPSERIKLVNSLVQKFNAQVKNKTDGC